MKTVNPYLLHTLLEPITGLADDDEAVLKYRELNPNNENQVRRIIRELIVPHAQTLTDDIVESVKLAYRYYLSRGDTKWDRVYNSNLPPFSAPDDARLFFLWVWEECFPREDYQLTNLESYFENPDVDEPWREQ